MCTVVLLYIRKNQPLLTDIIFQISCTSMICSEDRFRRRLKEVYDRRGSTFWGNHLPGVKDGPSQPRKYPTTVCLHIFFVSNLQYDSQRVKFACFRTSRLHVFVSRAPQSKGLRYFQVHLYRKVRHCLACTLIYGDQPYPPAHGSSYHWCYTRVS